MRLSSPLVSLAVLAGASACEEPYELDQEGLIAHIVVDASLEAGKAPQVGIRAANVFGQAARGAPVSESFVTLENSDGRTFDLPLADASAISDSVAVFTAPDEVIVVGLTYRLRVETPGFARLRSETTVPAGVGFELASQRVDSASYQPVAYDSAANQLSLGFRIDEAGPGSDHYHVMLAAIGQGGRTYLPVVLARNLSVAHDLGAGGVLLNGGAFTAGQIDNRVLIDRARLTELAAHSVEMEVRTVSTPYFEALADGEPNESLGGAFPVGREAAPDNISGGRGVFASYSSTRSWFELDR